MNIIDNWECEDCGWHGHADDLETKCTFHATQEEPAEYDAWCPQCGADFDRMIEFNESEEE